MSKGIAKERLRDVFGLHYWDSANAEDLLDRLLGECTELDPWIPIGQVPFRLEAQVDAVSGPIPPPIRVLLLYPELPNTPRQRTGTWYGDHGDPTPDLVISRCIRPTHYKLLKD